MSVHSPRELALLALAQRKKLKLSQTEVGDLIGLKQRSISAFENKPENTQLETVFRILAALNLDLKVLEKNDTSVTTHAWKYEW